MGGAFQLTRGVAQQVGGSAKIVSSGQSVVSGAHLLQDGLGMAEYLPAGGQLFFFLRLQRGGLDLVHLKAQQFQPALFFGLVHLQRVRLAFDCDQLTVDLAVFAVLLFVLGVEIQQRQMAGRIGQILIVVLPVDVDETGGEIPQHGCGGRHAVDPAVALAFGTDLTIKKKFVSRLIACLFQLAANSLGQVGKGGPDTGFARPGADKVAAGAVAQNGIDGVDQDTFACARLAGQNVQTGRELRFGLLDDRNIFNFQILQQSPSAPFSVLRGRAGQ